MIRLDDRDSNASSPKARSRDNLIPQLFDVRSSAKNQTQRSGMKSGLSDQSWRFKQLNLQSAELIQPETTNLRRWDVKAPPRTDERRVPQVDYSLGTHLDTWCSREPRDMPLTTVRPTPLRLSHRLGGTKIPTGEDVSDRHAPSPEPESP